MTSTLNDHVLGLCRERVPLGVIARALELPRSQVKGMASAFCAEGLIGEMPADDIRDGMVFSWPEKMLPNAPEMGEEAQPQRRRATLANLDAKGARLLFHLRQIKPGTMRWALCDALATEQGETTLDQLVAHLVRLGFQSSANSIMVTITGLRGLGLIIAYRQGLGYRMAPASRDLWDMAMRGDIYA